MKKNYRVSLLYILLSIFAIQFSFSQTKEELEKITSTYDKQKLKELADTFQKNYQKEYSKAMRLAKQKGWKIKYEEGSKTYKLRKVINGKPIYISSDNADAAISTRTNYLHNGGGLGLDLEGQNMTIHVWEAEGVPNLDHNEYDGAGGMDRVSIGDDATDLDDHAGHVVGTLIASGFQAAAKGMAPQASAIAYDVSNDLAEATIAASNGALLSNHSYGVRTENLTNDLSWIIGAYIQDSKNWDDLMYNAPYYLAVYSAGNDGDNNTNNSDPSAPNYDKLSFDKTAKNTLVVASGSDAVIDMDGNFVSSTRSSFSSEGPTDDLRIKPEIMGNGERVYSSFTRRPFSYDIIDGTSMAAPNVSGSLLLLQQYYNQLNGSFMKAATLKGVALHTADDVEDVGPDATSGWGLLNSKAAAETIANNGLSSWISQETLQDGGSFSIDVVSDGVSPLLASISWTDQGGQANSAGIFNDATPVLVNDLDIRVTQSTNTFTPWKLTAADANTQGDNNVDPYERVDVTGAAGTYTITVTHKGNLTGGSQDFSLIVTGLSSNFTFNTQTPDQTICSDNDATYSFNYLESGADITNFSLGNIPAGATTSITPNSLDNDGSFNVVFSNLSNVSANTYDINITGDDGNESESRFIKLRVLHTDFSPYPQTLLSPVNGASSLSTSLNLQWEENLNAENYLIEVSTNPSFSSLLYSNTQTEVESNLSGFTSEGIYYWRVRPSNSCGDGNYSATYSFQVGSISCGSHTFAATDFSDGNILTTPGDTASAPVTVSTGGLNVDSVETSFEINHTWVNDITIFLESPSSNGNALVLLFESSCSIDNGGDENPGDGDDFNVTYSDSGAELFCDDVNIPSISDTVLPIEPLSNFSGIGADGVWTLRVLDPNDNDGGDITAFSVSFCLINDMSSIPNFMNNGFDAPLNSTYTFLSTDIEATSSAESSAQQVYTILSLPTKGNLAMEASTINVGDTFTQEDINTGKITYTNTETAEFADAFTVDIKNAANGWLANQVISMNSGLSVDKNIMGAINIWPNPAKETLNIKLDNLLTSDNVKVYLYDLQGRKIVVRNYKTNSNTLQKSINTSNLLNGIYLLQVEQGDRKSTRKIIINK